MHKTRVCTDEAVYIETWIGTDSNGERGKNQLTPASTEVHYVEVENGFTNPRDIKGLCYIKDKPNDVAFDNARDEWDFSFDRLVGNPATALKGMIIGSNAVGKIRVHVDNVDRRTSPHGQWKHCSQHMPAELPVEIK